MLLLFQKVQYFIWWWTTYVDASLVLEDIFSSSFWNCNFCTLFGSEIKLRVCMCVCVRVCGQARGGGRVSAGGTGYATPLVCSFDASIIFMFLTRFKVTSHISRFSQANLSSLATCNYCFLICLGVGIVFQNMGISKEENKSHFQYHFHECRWINGIFKTIFKLVFT